MEASSVSVKKFLSENAIQYKSCDLNAPFAFISYSHDAHDSIIIRSAFEMLHLMGFNLWIDVANIPFDQNSWKNAAMRALKSPNCKMALFFRSEDSLTKEAVADEIETIAQNHDTSVVTIDIWSLPNSTAQQVYNNLQMDVENNPDDEDIKLKCSACERICNIIDPNNSAIRLAKECQNDIKLVVDKIAELMVRAGFKVITRSDDDYDYSYEVVDGKYIATPKDSNDLESKLRDYATSANEEIERVAQEYRNNDFGILADMLKELITPMQVIEDNYKKLSVIKDRIKGLKRSMFFRRDIIFRIFWISFVVILVLSVFVSTLKDTGIYYLLMDHTQALSVITDLFRVFENENVQVFIDTIVASLFDSILVSVLIIMVPALVKSVILVINNIKAGQLKRKGQALIKDTIPALPNYPDNYMCTFAMEFFIKCSKTRKATDLSSAMLLFDEYKKSPEGIRSVAAIAMWLHDMREGFEKVRIGK